MRFYDEGEAITYIFRSIARLRDVERGPDEDSRDTTPTKQLIQMADLLDYPREYAVVTGSKGKGSTTVITAKLLQHLGHTVGTITSPHLVSWRERIRVNGRAIPSADFVRILDSLAPYIDQIESTLTGKQYFSPQGIFLAIALRWFDEQGVNAAVLEVGRGGRYDDISVVPNRLSLFTPIMLEHVKQLGRTIERIAWHKAGIIKPYSYAYSVPQAPEALAMIQTEADAVNAEFAWIAPQDMGEYLGETETGVRMRYGRYGDMTLSLKGTYQVMNATLAIQGAGNMHGRLAGISHASPEYLAAIHTGLADVKWYGRMHKLQDRPAIWVDGSTTVVAARSVLESIPISTPLITILGTPVDRDYEGVYQVFARRSAALILTESKINFNVRFPDPDTALTAARQYHSDVTYVPSLDRAVELARAKAGLDGTIVLAVAQPLVGEAMLLWGFNLDAI